GEVWAVEAAAVPAVPALEVAVAALAAGAPPHEPANRPAVFGFAAGGVGSALAGDGDSGCPEGVQVVVDGVFAVVAVGCHGFGDPAGVGGDRAYRRAALWGAWRL